MSNNENHKFLIIGTSYSAENFRKILDEYKKNVEMYSQEKNAKTKALNKSKNTQEKVEIWNS